MLCVYFVCKPVLCVCMFLCVHVMCVFVFCVCVCVFFVYVRFVSLGTRTCLTYEIRMCLSPLNAHANGEGWGEAVDQFFLQKSREHSL